MSAYLITNARVLDGSGQAPFAGAVRVEANRITEVTPGAAPPPARGATVIDAGGATLMPGLVESHAHLGFADMTSQELTRLPPEEHMLVTVRNAKLMLDCGYTSAFSAASPKARLDVVLKREIEAGRVPGPRLEEERARDADVLLGRRRRRAGPPRVPTARPRGGRPAEAQSLRRRRDVELSLGPDADERSRGWPRPWRSRARRSCAWPRIAAAPSP